MKRNGTLPRFDGSAGQRRIPRLHDLSIGTRILAGFGVAIAILFLFALVGLFSQYGLTRDVEALARLNIVARTATDVDLQLRKVDITVGRYQDTGSIDDRADAERRLADSRVAVGSLSDALARTPLTQAPLDAVTGALNDYARGMEALVGVREARRSTFAEQLSPALDRARDQLSRLKGAGGVDSAALAGDGAVAVLLAQDHLSRYVARQELADLDQVHAQLAVARTRMSEMNRYLWVPGTQAGIAEVEAALTQADQMVALIQSQLGDEQKLRSQQMAGPLTRVADLTRDLRQQAEAAAEDLRSGLDTQPRDWLGYGLWLGAAMIVLALLAMWMVRRSITRPVTQIADALSSLAVGHTAVNLPDITGRDEIAGMSRALRDLRDHAEGVEQVRNAALQRHDVMLLEKDRAETVSRAKTNFLVKVGHELHGPLNNIIHSSQSLMGELHRHGVGELANEVEQIQWTGEQLVSMVDAILDYAKIEAGTMDVCLQEFDVGRLLTEVRERSLPAADLNGNEIAISPPSEPPGQMSQDFAKVQQILLNLLDNACKFTSNGDITLAANSEMRDGMRWVAFTVADSGRGFAVTQVSRLFQPFVQGTEARSQRNTAQKNSRGAGLGLTLVGHYTAMLGGDIEIASEPGAGTRITVRLPAEYQVSEDQRPLLIESQDSGKPDESAAGARPLLTIAPLHRMAKLKG